ncbi:MAG: hypothetical protein QGG73_02055 [Candidatus Hydrogenedentes bacterium]|jgi:hypothetical protein|nr:hypothetical protein [Candidatus Hydrogenedentota bacterium]
MENADAILRASGQFAQECLIEAAGVFWIGAEVVILFAVTAALRHFSSTPLPPAFALTPAEKRRAFWWAGGVALLCAATFGRHLVLMPIHTALAAIEPPLNGKVDAIYFSRAHIHLTVWCSFIAAWVVLEAAIVFQGVRAFARLRRLVRHEN